MKFRELLRVIESTPATRVANSPARDTTYPAGYYGAENLDAGIKNELSKKKTKKSKRQ